MITKLTEISAERLIWPSRTRPRALKAIMRDNMELNNGFWKNTGHAGQAQQSWADARAVDKTGLLLLSGRASKQNFRYRAASGEGIPSAQTVVLIRSIASLSTDAPLRLGPDTVESLALLSVVVYIMDMVRRNMESNLPFL